MPALTFIIPAFNARGTIGQTIASIRAQTRADWSAVIVDDGSTDGCFDSPQTRRAAGIPDDPRITTLRTDNRGVAAARNTGLAQVSTPAVAFIDSDDAIEPRYMETLLNRLHGHDVVSCDYRYKGPNLEDVGWIVQSPAPESLREFNQFAIGALVFDRASLVRLAGAAPFPSGTRQEDWRLLRSLAGARWAPPVREALYTYRLRPESRTTALREIWRDGLNLIAGSGDADSMRRWTIRNLARAAAACDRALCRCMMEHLEPLTDNDVDTLSGALRWALRRAAVAREPQSLRLDWSEGIRSALSNDPIGELALARARELNWERVAEAAASRLAPHQTLVIYGLGRNGLELLRALQSRHISPAIIDDGKADSANLTRLTVADLRPEHLVLVTPDDRQAILHRLAQINGAQVILPEQLVA